MNANDYSFREFLHLASVGIVLHHLLLGALILFGALIVFAINWSMMPQHSETTHLFGNLSTPFMVVLLAIALPLYLSIRRKIDLVEVKEKMESQAARLAETHNFLQLVLQSVSSRVYWKDKDLNFVGCNKSFATDAGLVEPDDVLGRSDYAMPWRLVAEEFRLDDQVVMDSDIAKIDYRNAIRNADGELLWIEGCKVPIKNIKGETVGMLGIYHDITDRLTMEAELKHAYLKAQEASRSKTEFLATMSHELRTPLNAIIGFGETLLYRVYGEFSNQEQRTAVSHMVESGGQLCEIIESILDISSIELGDFEIDEEIVDMRSQIETALQMVEHRATVAEVKLVNLIDRDLPKLFCDKKRMTQVFINLLTNAVKFTPKGGTISINAPINADGNFALSITDTGIGMDEGEIKMAFERFCQIDRVSFDAQEGVGLGLPFVKELVEAHGGSLGIVSQPGAGTTVTVELPKERLMN